MKLRASKLKDDALIESFYDKLLKITIIRKITT